MEGLLSSVSKLVTDALNAAGNLAGMTADAAFALANGAMAMYQQAYEYFLTQGLSPEDAADKAEVACRNYLRDVYGIHIL